MFGDAIAENPVEAEKLKLLSALMTGLCDFIKEERLTKKKAAKRLAVSPETITDLLHGRIDLFGFDNLVGMIGAAGLHIEVRIDKAA